MAASWAARPRAPRGFRSSASFPLEARLALLHERAPAFLVVHAPRPALDRRAPAPGVRRAGGVHVPVDRAALGARLVEFRDVGAGGKGLAARAAERDAAHFAIGVEARHRLGDAAPHRAIDRVAPLRIIENDPADARLLLDFQAHGLPAGP